MIGVFDGNGTIAVSLLQKATHRSSAPAARTVSLPQLPLPISAGTLPPLPNARNASRARLRRPEKGPDSVCPERIRQAGDLSWLGVLRVRRPLHPLLGAESRR